MDTFRKLWSQHRYTAFGLFFVSVFVMGWFGWMQTESMSAWEAAYRSLALFVLDGATQGDISPLLNFARFAAPIATSWAIVGLVLRVVRSQSTLSRAIRLRNHTVVLGGGHEAALIARGFRTRVTPAAKSRVLAIGAFDPADSVQLTRAGVFHLDAADDHDLRRILQDAARVVVAEGDDTAAAAASRRVRKLNDDPGLPVVTLLADRELARSWPRSGADSVVCRPSLIASSVLRQAPPYPEDSLAPSPIVLGDGRLASEIVRGIIVGWQQPGETLTVHCAGGAPGWADAAISGLAIRGRAPWHSVTPHTDPGPHTVREALDEWRPPQKRDRYTVQPATVYVAFDQDTRTVRVAQSLSRGMQDMVRVVAVVDDVDTWSQDAATSSILFLGREELLCDPDHLCRDATTALADEIIADLGRWPADTPSAFGPVHREAGAAATLASQTEHVRRAIIDVAAQIELILGSGGLVVTDRPGDSAAVVLDPSELTAIAHKLGEVLGSVGEPTEEARLRLLELAGRLPTLLLRTGRTPVRPDERPDTLDASDIVNLARAIHAGYLIVAEATGNATGSDNAKKPWEELDDTDRRSNIAQGLDIPLKLAMVGLTYKPAERPRRYQFTGKELDLLGEQEHRRWAHFEMRNGRHGHTWNLPWAELDAGAKQYDLDAVALIPGLLAYVHLEITGIDDQHPPQGEYLPPRETNPEGGARPFRRIGRAWAFPLNAPHRWRSSGGDDLLAQAGDWWVVTEDGTARSVSPDAFLKTYRHVSGPEYVRCGTVNARQVRRDDVIWTREGQAQARVGDWLVTDQDGNTWPVPDQLFTRLYVPGESER